MSYFISDKEKQLFEIKILMTQTRKIKQFEESDVRFMSMALSLARQAKGSTFPNPSVGAVIVKNNEIVATGATSFCGGPHAEKVALTKAGPRSRGSTMYVTLEPCCHFGRTGPCTEAIIEAGIKRVFVSVSDPNPLVCGRGVRMLRSHGIAVEMGLLRDEAWFINEDFFFWITKGRPWVSVKLAMTLDGRITDAAGASRWITSKEARTYAHTLRARHAAVGVGYRTLEKDNPRLTVRHVKGADPVRFVFSSTADVPSTSYFVTRARGACRSRAAGPARLPKSILVVSGGRSCVKQRLDNGLGLWYTGTRDRQESLHAFLRMAREEEISSVLIEGGQRLASRFLESRLVNRLYLFFGNRIVGGGLAGISFEGGLQLDRSIVLDNMEITRLGGDFLVTGIPIGR
jgi:diaminohydroxyphosphoribosylaminopyrimidine deaminase / 5-amino-6-(5-phosphoribosylamino)uracil reductase